MRLPGSYEALNPRTWVTFSVTFWERSFTLEGLSSSILGVGGERHSGPLLAGPPLFIRSESDMELWWPTVTGNMFVLMFRPKRSLEICIFTVFFFYFVLIFCLFLLLSIKTFGLLLLLLQLRVFNNTVSYITVIRMYFSCWTGLKFALENLNFNEKKKALSDNPLLPKQISPCSDFPECQSSCAPPKNTLHLNTG